MSKDCKFGGNMPTLVQIQLILVKSLLECSCWKFQYLLLRFTDLLHTVKYADLFLSGQTSTHVFLITDFFPGGELFALLDKQPMNLFKEESARYSQFFV